MKKFTLLAMTAAVSLAAWGRPDSPTDFEAQFSLVNGEAVVSGSFVCPTHQYSWDEPEPIEKITKVKVTRGCSDVGETDIVVFELDNAEPGQKINFTDEFGELEFGYDYYYKAFVCDENGEEGYGSSKYVYVGIRPAVPGFTTGIGDKGTLPATFTMTAPTKDADGNELTVPLTELCLKEYVSWDSEPVIHTIKDPVAGKTYEWSTSDITENEQHSYRLYAVCAYGKSEPARAYVLVGEDEPAAPTNLVVTPNEDGTITITWDAPTEGRNGGYLNPESVMYRVVRQGDMDATLAEDYKDTTYTDDLGKLTGPTVVKYEIDAYNEHGDHSYVTSDEMIVGPSYQLPYIENFNSGSVWYKNPDNKWTFDPSYFGNWELTDRAWRLDYISGVDAKDPSEDEESEDDGAEGFLLFDHSYADPGDEDIAISSAIDFTKAEYPVMSFYTVSNPNEESVLEFGLVEDGKTSKIDSLIPSDFQKEDELTWVRHYYPMEEAAGKEIGIYLKGYLPENAQEWHSYGYGVDKIIIADYPGVTEVKSESDDEGLRVSWAEPVNSFDEAPESYDLVVDGVEKNVTVPEYSFAETRSAEVHKISIRANYGEVKGKYSEEFLVSAEGSGIGSIINANTAKVEYFDVNGMKVNKPVKGMTIIRRTIGKDGSVKTEKIIVRD